MPLCRRTSKPETSCTDTRHTNPRAVPLSPVRITGNPKGIIISNQSLDIIRSLWYISLSSASCLPQRRRAYTYPYPSLPDHRDRQISYSYIIVSHGLYNLRYKRSPTTTRVLPESSIIPRPHFLPGPRDITPKNSPHAPRPTPRYSRRDGGSTLRRPGARPQRLQPLHR